MVSLFLLGPVRFERRSSDRTQTQSSHLPFIFSPFAQPPPNPHPHPREQDAIVFEKPGSRRRRGCARTMMELLKFMATVIIVLRSIRVSFVRSSPRTEVDRFCAAISIPGGARVAFENGCLHFMGK